MNLADTQIKQEFDADGYVAMYSFFEDNKIQEIKNEIDRYINDIVPNLPNHHVFYEDKSDKTTIKNLQQMFTYDDYFKKLIEESAIQEVASFVLGEKAVPKNLQYFNKPAGVGKPTPPHQDGYYFMLKKHNAVTCWLALEKVDEENGCIHYVRGSHLDAEYRPHGKSNILGFSQGVTDFGNANDGNPYGLNRPFKYFTFNQNSPSQMASFRNLIENIVPSGNYILIYTPMENRYDYWDAHQPQLYQMFQNMGSDSIFVGCNRPNKPFIFLTRKGDPNFVVELFCQNNEDIFLDTKLINETR